MEPQGLFCLLSAVDMLAPRVEKRCSVGAALIAACTPDNMVSTKLYATFRLIDIAIALNAKNLIFA
jgi:hypothetical protein